MTIQIDNLSKTITLSVGDLCEADLCGGSLNLTPFVEARSQMGRTVHSDLQARRVAQFPTYRKEQSIRFTTRQGEYVVIIQGRIDGFYEAEGQTVIEEIKSVLEVDENFPPRDVPSSYLLQLKLYLYLWKQLHPMDHLIGQLVLIGCESGQESVLEVQPNDPAMEGLIHEQLNKIIKNHEITFKVQGDRKIRADLIQFPFPQMRKFQDRMIEAVEAALNQQSHLLISAPAGIGKTVAALYATLKYAARNGFSVYFLTSKTTQQRIVADTLRLFVSERAPEPPVFSSLILRSKEKICANDVVFCHEARCQYAKDFYAKLEDSNVCDNLAQLPIITPELIYARGVEHEVCPFELSLELLDRVDLTVCDYNYIYDPRVAIQRTTGKDRGRTILIVDEAHNLYSRAREYYSPQLELERIRSLRRTLESALNPSEDISPGLLSEIKTEKEKGDRSQPFVGRINNFLRVLEGYFIEVGDSYPEIHEDRQAVISLDKDFFRNLRDQLDDLLKSYLVHQRRAGHFQNEVELLRFFYDVSDFCKVLELEGEEFVHLCQLENQSPRLKIVCLDPSQQLRKRNEQFHAVIGMSATLSPLEFYRDVLGFDRDTQLLSLPSPFPPENRKILVVPDVSTTFQRRSQNFPRIARIIEQVIGVRTGNYFAFFPSFEFLEEVARLLNPKNYQVLKQSKVMPDHSRNALLEKLADPGEAHLILAVQGGVFAEGVDYPGELAIGAIIAGPGLPKVSIELELMRQYYEESYSKGFEYAYLYPGMNRVVQSAGRVIRSETDRGVILLLDRRFTQENYNRLFPRDWYDASPAELVSKNYLHELNEFWKAKDKSP